MRLLFFVIFFGVFCVSEASASSGSVEGKIRDIYLYEGHGGPLIQMDNMADIGGCGRGDYFILDRAHALYDQIYALILAAHIANQSLRLEINGCLQGISRIQNVNSYR